MDCSQQTYKGAGAYESERTTELRRPALERIAAVLQGVPVPTRGGRPSILMQFSQQAHKDARTKGDQAAAISMRDLQTSTLMCQYIYATLSTIWKYSVLFLAHEETFRFGEELQMHYLVLARRVQGARTERERHDDAVAFDFESRMSSWLTTFIGLGQADDDKVSREFLLKGGVHAIPYTKPSRVRLW